MDSSARRIRSELPSGDPALLNRLAWARRWLDREASINNAKMARKTALAGSGSRSRVQQGHALRTLAWQARWRGDFNEAMGYCLSAETFLPENEHAEDRAVIYAILGGIHFARNRFDLSNSAVERGFWLLRDFSEQDVADALTALLLTRVTIQRYTGERARAGITLGRAQQVATEDTAPCVEYCTASWLLADGDADAARSRAVNAMETATVQGNAVLLPYIHALVGKCDIQLGRFDEALECLEMGRKLAEEGQDHRVRCFAHRHMAEIDIVREDLRAAQHNLEQAARIAKTQGHAFERKRIALALADLFEKQGNFKKAVVQHKLAWRLQNETRTN